MGKTQDKRIYADKISGMFVREVGAVFTNREWYTKACEGSIYITEPYIDQVSGQFMYHLLKGSHKGRTGCGSCRS